MDSLLFHRGVRVRPVGGRESIWQARSCGTIDRVTRGVRQNRELEFRDCRVDPKKSCPKARLQDWRSCSSDACCGERSQRRPESLSYARSDGERARARAVRPDGLTAGRGMKRTWRGARDRVRFFGYEWLQR